jgi:hypothetical protein
MLQSLLANYERNSTHVSEYKHLITALTEQFANIYGEELFPHGRCMTKSQELDEDDGMIQVVRRYYSPIMPANIFSDDFYNPWPSKMCQINNPDVEVIILSKEDFRWAYFREFLYETYICLRSEVNRLANIGYEMRPFILFDAIKNVNPMTFEPELRFIASYGVCRKTTQK